ncbi:MAG: hypothetical protein Q8Q47_04260, partial [Ignavibacteriaceae bacterium]|nr:hypothetical protein [Ignavibacteriaceae bacterium]
AAPINNKVGTAEIHLFMENFSGDSNELVLKLKEKIPHYMIPSYFHYVPSFPLNSNGKVDRKALINIYSKN